MRKTSIDRIFIAAGTFCLALGIIGIFVPVLPTTPFLLLAAACYARGSQRMHKWLLGNRIFGVYLKNYLEGKGMPLKIKAFTLIILWLGISLTIAFGIENWAIRATLAAIATGVSIHIILIKAKPPAGK